MRKFFWILNSLLLISCHFCYGQLVLLDKNVASNDYSSFGNAIISKDSTGLRVKTPYCQEESGIRINGNWDLQIYDQMEIELVNYAKNTLRVAVRLENPNMDMKNRKNLFRDYVSISPNKVEKIVLDIPRKRFYPEVEERLFGMHINPYGTPGDRWFPERLVDLDPQRVVALSFYQDPGREGSEWGIKHVRVLNNGRYDVPVWMTLSGDKFFPFVDKYGQFKFKNWPGKIYSDNDLRLNKEKEQRELDSYPGPTNWSKYGGWKDGPKLEAKGHFYVAKIKGKWWMVDPEGYLFWSHGIVRVTPSCGITPLDGRKFYFEGLPIESDPDYGLFYQLHDELLKPYYTKRGIKETYNFSAANIKRKYGDEWEKDFADMCHKRLRSWGLNTIANSSDKYIYSMSKTPYCERFEIKSPSIAGSANTGWWWDFRDPFHPDFKANVRAQLLERKKEIDDPWCYGFFVDNELNWGGDYTLAFWTLKSPAAQPAKRHFMAYLKKKYKKIDELNRAWNSNYENWHEFLLRKEELGKAHSKAAYADCKDFSLIIIDAYFKNIKDVFRKVAPNKLYMGCRFAGRGREDVLRCAAKHCDVISYNIYNKTLDWLKLPEGIDKPVMIGEFHFGALDRGLFHPSLIQVSDQKARGEAYETYVESALRHPNIIGTHWHQFSDQMLTGRFDGECFQVGFTDICDTPYPETISKVREVGYHLYDIRNNDK